MSIVGTTGSYMDGSGKEYAAIATSHYGNIVDIVLFNPVLDIASLVPVTFERLQGVVVARAHHEHGPGKFMPQPPEPL